MSSKTLILLESSRQLTLDQVGKVKESLKAINEDKEYEFVLLSGVEKATAVDLGMSDAVLKMAESIERLIQSQERLTNALLESDDVDEEEVKPTNGQYLS